MEYRRAPDMTLSTELGLNNFVGLCHMLQIHEHQNVLTCLCAQIQALLCSKVWGALYRIRLHSLAHWQVLNQSHSQTVGMYRAESKKRDRQQADGIKLKGELDRKRRKRGPKKEGRDRRSEKEGDRKDSPRRREIAKTYSTSTDCGVGSCAGVCWVSEFDYGRW